MHAMLNGTVTTDTWHHAPLCVVVQVPLIKVPIAVGNNRHCVSHVHARAGIRQIVQIKANCPTRVNSHFCIEADPTIHTGTSCE